MLNHKDAGQYYDEIGAFYELVWGENIHMGFWQSPDDAHSLAVAQNNLTDLFIEQTLEHGGTAVLDIGCGVGEPAIRLAERSACQLTGITISERQVRQALMRVEAKELNGRVRCSYMNALSLAFPSASFDVVWALESIFHMPDRQRVFQEIHRVLRPNGRLILTDFVARKQLAPTQQLFMSQLFQMQPLLEIGAYAQLLQQSGYVVEQFRDISVNIAPTIDAWKANIARQQTELTRVYNGSFVSMINAYAPQIEETYRQDMGYIFAVAQKA